MADQQTDAVDEESAGIKRSVQRQFGAAAAHYAQSAVHTRHGDQDALLSAWAWRGDEQVLDVGCGTGHTTLALARHAGSVTGLDLTEAMLAQGRDRARADGVENVHYERGDAEDLPFEHARFDVVTCRLCAHHFPRAHRAVAEMARVLKPGGALLLSDSVSPDAAAPDTFLNCVELLRDPSHVRNHSAAQWRRMFEACGLECEELGAHPMRLEFDDWFRRMRTPLLPARCVRELFACAPEEIQRTFDYAPASPKAWTIPIAAFRGWLPSRA